MQSGVRNKPSWKVKKVFRTIVRTSCIAVGLIAFYYFAAFFNRAIAPEQRVAPYHRVGFMVTGVLLGILLAPYIQSYLISLHSQMLKAMRKFTPELFFKGFVGLIAGFMLSVLVSIPILMLLPEHRTLGLVLAVLGSIVFGYLGVMIFVHIEIPGLEKADLALPAHHSALPKVLDTSVLIDGRILELCQQRFMEGSIHVPSAVLEELQKIADDSDEVRRKKGRRGLDIVKQLREEAHIPVEFPDVDSYGVKSGATDSRLLAFTKILGGILVTNDYNLAQVAEVRDVTVWNLNTLAGALRKTLLPGEKMEVNVVKYGKEVGQGIAYLDDGTMIVIESADKFIGETIEVEIKSMLQTVAGRLIFATVSRPPEKEEE